MNTPNNAAALERLETKWRDKSAEFLCKMKDQTPGNEGWYDGASETYGTCADELATLRATLAQPDALTVRIAHKGPADFPNHQCPAESSAVWNACCMEHERVLAGEVPMLTTTALTSQPSGVAVAWPERMVNLPCPDGTTDRIVGFRVEEGSQILGKFGLSEPIAWLRSVTVDRHTNPSADAPGVAVDEALRSLLLNIVDNLNDTPVNEDWATRTADKLLAALAPKPEGGHG